MTAGIAGSAYGLAKAGFEFGKRRAAGIGGMGAAYVSPDTHQAVTDAGGFEKAVAKKIADLRRGGVDRSP